MIIYNKRKQWVRMDILKRIAMHRNVELTKTRETKNLGLGHVSHEDWWRVKIE